MEKKAKTSLGKKKLFQLYECGIRVLTMRDDVSICLLMVAHTKLIKYVNHPTKTINGSQLAKSKKGIPLSCHCHEI